MLGQFHGLPHAHIEGPQLGMFRKLLSLELYPFNMPCWVELHCFPDSTQQRVCGVLSGDTFVIDVIITGVRPHLLFHTANFLPTAQVSAFAWQEVSLCPAEQALNYLKGEKTEVLSAAKTLLVTLLTQRGSH